MSLWIDNEIIGLIVVVVAVFLIMNYLECKTSQIVIFELYVITELSLINIINYAYFAICIMILSIMIYFKIQKHSD